MAEERAFPSTKTLLDHAPRIRALAKGLLLDSGEADDLVQETWLAASKSKAPEVNRGAGWFTGIARNLARNMLRGRSRRRSHEQCASRSEPVSAYPEHAEMLEFHIELIEALTALNEPYRGVIYLRYFECLSFDEIAARTKCPVPTVLSQAQRGLDLLKRRLTRDRDRDRLQGILVLLAHGGAPLPSGVAATPTISALFLVLGGLVMKKIGSAVLLVAALIGGIFWWNGRDGASHERSVVETPAPTTDGGPSTLDVQTAVVPTVRQDPVVDDPPGGVSAVAGTAVLRVILEGITEEDARKATVTLTGHDKRAKWPGLIQDSWPCQGLTSEFDLDPFFATVAERDGNLRDELEIAVDHPLHLIKKTRVPLSSGVEPKGGQTVYEVRARLVRPVFWPEFTLAVRDAHTRAHLNDVELRIVPTGFMAAQLPTGEPYTSLGSGLSSPIVLLGAREADGPEDWVAGMALGPEAGEAPQLADLGQPEATERGVLLYARAPGYAWSTIVLDVSTGGERELLLGPAATLDVRMANLQLVRDATLDTEATLRVIRPRPLGVEDRVWSQRLDETLETDWLRLENLEPGEYVISLELDQGSWKKRPVLAREELSLAAGETRELVLALSNPPTSPERATLGGVVSFPAFGGEEKVRILLYYETWSYGNADFNISLSDLERVGGALPAWSFRLEDLPVGLYQVRLWPFQTSWMIELPAGGREDVELVIPELAEVLIETVDAWTGERIPLDEIVYRHREILSDQVSTEQGLIKTQRFLDGGDWARADFEGEPGRFRFWTAPGAAYVSTSKIPSGLDYGTSRKVLKLVPGLQSVRFELAPVYAIRFEFHVDGAALPRDDAVYHFQLSRGIRAIDHEGRVTFDKAATERLVELSAPGAYEISFEGVGSDRFQPIRPQRVDVRPGEMAEVIVELRRK